MLIYDFTVGFSFHYLWLVVVVDAGHRGVVDAGVGRERWLRILASGIWWNCNAGWGDSSLVHHSVVSIGSVIITVREHIGRWDVRIHHSRCGLYKGVVFTLSSFQRELWISTV